MSISDNMKVGKQELLLGNISAIRCGTIITGLLANDLVVLLVDGTTVPLLTYIQQVLGGVAQPPLNTTNNTVFITFGQSNSGLSL
jgi:hypothetical protein